MSLFHSSISVDVYSSFIPFLSSLPHTYISLNALCQFILHSCSSMLNMSFLHSFLLNVFCLFILHSSSSELKASPLFSFLLCSVYGSYILVHPCCTCPFFINFCWMFSASLSYVLVHPGWKYPFFFPSSWKIMRISFWGSGTKRSMSCRTQG